MSDIFQEVQEEYRREQFAKAWDKYRVPIIGAAGGLILAVAGYQGWTYWHSAQVEASSRLFEATTTAVEAKPGEQKAAATTFAELADKGWGGYPFVARLQAAATLAASGDVKGGAAGFDRIAADTSDPIFADYARLRAAILLVDTAPLAEIQKRIGKLPPVGEDPWRVEAEEFLGYANWRAGNNKEALRLFDLIKNNPSASEGVKRRAAELSALINGGIKIADLKVAPTVAPTPRSQLPVIPGLPSFDTTPTVTPDPAVPASPTAQLPRPKATEELPMIRLFPTRPRATVAVLVLLSSVSLAGCETLDQFIQPGTKDRIKGERVSVLTTDQSVEPDPKLRDAKVVLPQPFVNPDWPAPGGYADNVMHHLSAPGDLKEVWSSSVGAGSSTNARLTASPVIAEGKIFALDANANVAAFDEKTGAQVWRVDLTPEDEDSEKGFGGGVAYDAGKLYVSTGFGFVVGLDASNGKELWRRGATVPFRAAPVVNGGRVFVATQENQLLALAADDGRVLWDHRGIAESAGMLGSNSVAVAGDVVVVPYTSGELFALRVQNGKAIWSDTLSRGGKLTPLARLADISGRPVIDRGLVFANSHAGRLVAIDIRTGERAWTIDVGGTQRPWVAGDYVFVITDDAKVICVSRADGRVRWARQLDAYSSPESRSGPIAWAGPVLVSDRLIAVSSDGYAVSISPYTGEVLGKVTTPDKSFIAPIVADNTVYLLTDDGRLTALR